MLLNLSLFHPVNMDNKQSEQVFLFTIVNEEIFNNLAVKDQQGAILLDTQIIQFRLFFGNIQLKCPMEIHTFVLPILICEKYLYH